MRYIFEVKELGSVLGVNQYEVKFDSITHYTHGSSVLDAISHIAKYVDCLPKETKETKLSANAARKITNSSRLPSEYKSKLVNHLLEEIFKDIRTEAEKGGNKVLYCSAIKFSSAVPKVLNTTIDGLRAKYSKNIIDVLYIETNKTIRQSLNRLGYKVHGCDDCEISWQEQ